MIGQTLGKKYSLAGLLGRGGMGAVYAAEHVETLARVAVKVLHGHLVESGGEGARRFHREAAAARSIESEHIVRVLDTGTDEATGLLYLVTERLDGEDLQRLLDRLGPLPLGGAMHIASQVLRGLAAAHAAHVVHRDIKPANIFLARGPGGALTVKLLDFGIAKVRVDPLGQTADLTTTGAFLGSPLYMSPEQVQNSREVDHRTDLWSVGCVLYAALAGRAPHQHSTTIGQLLVATCTTPAPLLSEVAPWVPREIGEIVHGALEIQASARYPSATAMLDALRPFVPVGALAAEMLAESGERHVAAEVSPRGRISAIDGPEIRSPRVVVAAGLRGPVRGDESTEQASLARGAGGWDAAGWGADRRARDSEAPGSSTLRSGASAGDAGASARPGTGDAAPVVSRSSVPSVGARAGARQLTIDPRRFLGEQSEMWTFSLDVHRGLSTLLARIWKALRRAGAQVPPMTYGTEWVLFEPRTGRTIAEHREEAGSPSLEDAGLRPGIVLWVMRPADVPAPK